MRSIAVGALGLFLISCRSSEVVPADPPLADCGQSPYDPADMGSCITVDENNDTKKYLTCMRDVLKAESTHGSVKEATKNLNRCRKTAPDDQIAIVGHGTVGRIIVGGGMSALPGRFISTRNEDQWKGSAKKLSGTSGMLTLVSCHTGAGKMGLNLLKRLHAHTGRPVRARTGITTCKNGEITFEEGSCWQVYPTRAGEGPIDPPPPPLPFTDFAAFELGGVLIQVRDVRSVRFLPGFSSEALSELDRSESAARELLKFISFADRLEVSGQPLAIITARMEIRYGPPSDTKTAELLIYNDRFAGDEATGRLFHLHPRLRDTLMAQRR